jgi:hypothetical protein
MTESFILDYIPKRMKQLGYQSWHIAYKDMAIKAESQIEIPAYNELWFLVGHPEDILIDSDYGVYDGTSNVGHNNEHEHRGLIIIKNIKQTAQRIKFIQTIIVN